MYCTDSFVRYNGVHALIITKNFMADKKETKKEGQKKVSIYSTPTCVYCNMAKDFFNENGIKYESFDVAADAVKRKEMMERSGQLGVPVITIDNDLLVGFDEDRLRDLLGVK